MYTSFLKDITINTLQEIEELIREFNQNNNYNLHIDSIRITFNKRYKLERLNSLGSWTKLKKNSNILHKLNNRLSVDEVTSAHRLENYNIYYYNKRDISKKYTKAELVIFGLQQYHKEPPKRSIVLKVIDILKDVSNIDVCFDMSSKPNFKELSKYFSLNQFIADNGVMTDTHYINNTNHTMIEKIVIYNKALKNSLGFKLWRIEAKIVIPNVKMIALPLSEFKEIINIARIKV